MSETSIIVAGLPAAAHMQVPSIPAMGAQAMITAPQAEPLPAEALLAELRRLAQAAQLSGFPMASAVLQETAEKLQRSWLRGNRPR